MKNKDLPPNMENVMVTYKKKFFHGPYGTKEETRKVTRMGFYSKLFENFSIPHEWKPFNFGGKEYLMPFGFAADRRTPSQIIKWEFIKEES
jgi:hypothetical protein